MRLHLGRLRREPEERPRDLAAAQVLGSAPDVRALGRDTGGRDGHVPHGFTDLGMEFEISLSRFCLPITGCFVCSDIPGLG